MNAAATLTRTAIAGAAAGVLAGGVLAAERAVLADLRRNPDPTSAADLGVPPGEEHTVTTPDGAPLHAVVIGAGSPVVLVHGFMMSRRAWALVAGRLVAAGHQVVLYDHRGHGRSGTGPAGFGFPALGDDLGAVLDHFDIHGAVVAGHSMGGMAALDYSIRHAADRRRRLAGLVLVATSARGRFLRVLRHRVQHPLLLTGLATAGLARPVQGTLAVLPLFGRAPAASQVEVTRQMVAECDPRTAAEGLPPLLGFDFTTKLDSVDTPAVVAAGGLDRLIPEVESRHLARHLPRVRLERFPAAGHMLNYERAAPLADLIRGLAPPA